MVIQFLRENKAVSFVLAVIRVYLGYTWLMAGIGKLQGKGFDATGYLQGLLKSQKEHNQPYNLGGHHFCKTSQFRMLICLTRL